MISAFRSVLLIFGLLFTSACLAWDPNEVLSDPALEQRARNISSQVRCLVCQNQSIDESDADLAKDLRLLVRERLTAGDSDKEIFEFLVSRYGEFVLLKPPFRLGTALLWSLPILLLLIGAIFILLSIRKRKQVRAEPDLSEADQVRLSEIVDRQ